jgi:hypothetical protein
VAVKIDKHGLTTNFLIKINNMAFKVIPPFNLALMNTSIFERDMGDDPVMARTPKNGVIILNEDQQDPIEKTKTVVHELVHRQQYLDEARNPGTGLDYEVDGAGKGKVTYKGKEYDYSVMQAGKGPWEKDAYKAEKNV